MGLFDKRDKKNADDFNSPVERIDLNAPPPELSSNAGADQAAPAAAAQEPADAGADDDDDVSSYGIEQAIELMRTLPSDNVELVVRVVKQTLESTHIKIPRIINDAAKKQSDIQGRIKVLRDEIAEHESEIATRRSEILSLEADYNETSLVKDRLSLAERLAAEGPSQARAPGATAGGENQARSRTARDSSTPLPTARARTASTPPPTGDSPARPRSVASSPATVGSTGKK
ncbi:MAG TPA: hypothetical protein VFG83_06620 [Kofleriaceae bacterium]|nr:hypothetical protein [Kofleriaceae bacterium]